MKYPFLIIVALAILLGSAALGYWRGGRKVSRVWVAHSGYGNDVPAMRTYRSRLRILTVAAGVCASIAALATALLTGMPVRIEHQSKPVTSRDIVLCLDASGSMLPFDNDIIFGMRQLVDQLHGERVGLQLWNEYSKTEFPLTDDYDLVRQRLDRLSSLLSTVQVVGSEVYGSEDLLTYLDDTVSTDPKGSSLVGDGIASCAILFPESEDAKPGSDTLIVATDNQPEGQSIYTLGQSLDFATQRGVSIYSIYSSNDVLSTNPKANEEFRSETERVGGKFFESFDSTTTRTILNDAVEGDEHDTPEPTTESDNNGWLIGWLVLAGLGALALGRRLRR